MTILFRSHRHPAFVLTWRTARSPSACSRPGCSARLLLPAGLVACLAEMTNRSLGGSEADDDSDGNGAGDEQEAVGATKLDSDGEEEEESDTKWLAWMTDMPRQFLVQQSQMTAQTSPASQASLSDPSSPLVEGVDRLPRTQEEERMFHADSERIRNLEPSSTVRANPPFLPSPMSNSFFDSLKQLSSRSSYESLNHPRAHRVVIQLRSLDYHLRMIFSLIREIILGFNLKVFNI